MLKYAEGNAKINKVNIHYYRTGGNKPSFILLHGATDNGLCWTPLAERLAEKYDVIMPDAQGHGLSDRLSPGFTFMDHAAQVTGLIQQLGLSKPLILGHSMGAGTAVNVAAEYPDVPGAIVLEDPGWRSEDSQERENQGDQTKQREAFFRVLAGYAKLTRGEIIIACRKDNPRWSEAEIGPWADAKLQFDPALFSTMTSYRPSYTESMPRIRCPALLIISDGGVVNTKTAVQAVQLWKSDKPFQWVQIKGAGHNIRREQFNEYCEKLFSFLRYIETLR